MPYHVQFPGFGWEFDINPIAFSIGDYKVYWYGIIIACGLLLAVLYAWKSAPRYKVDGSKLINCVFAGIITGIIGARLYFCFFKWDYYGQNPIEILYINNGGLAIYGGIIGALLGGLTVAKIQKMEIMPVLDIAMVGFLIGQGIGRWGNFMNQEAYGSPTDLPWRMMSEGTDNIGVHPCFFYESMWCLLGFVLLHFYGKYKQKYSGQIFFMYLVWYDKHEKTEAINWDDYDIPLITTFPLAKTVTEGFKVHIMDAVNMAYENINSASLKKSLSQVTDISPNKVNNLKIVLLKL